MARNNNKRTFSFEQDSSETLNFPPPQQTQYRPAAQTYQVSNPAAFLPDFSRHRPPSPTSSRGSNSPPSAYRARDTRFDTSLGGYGSPQHDHPSGGRMSAYRMQRQEDTAYRSGSPSRTRQAAGQPLAQVSLQGHNTSIPLPPPHTRSYSPERRQPYESPGSYHDRSPSRDPFLSSPGRLPSPDRDNPFATPNRSRANLAAPAAVAGLNSLDYGRPHPDRLNTAHSGYSDTGSTNFRTSRMDLGGLGGIDPIDIEDEDDDPFSSIPNRPGRRGVLGGAPAAAATGAAAGAAGFFKGFKSRDNSGQYGAVPGGSVPKKEQSAWLNKQNSSNKKLKWMVGGLIVLVVVLAIIGGVVGVLVSKKKSSSSSSTNPNASLTKDSPQVQAVMNNKNLHKVFPGIDYTPQNAQYPDCINDPPSQAYVTLDVAVLSQLTPVIRLYGTDCKQTEMVLKALDILDLKDSIKIWAGVWLDTNTTTSTRQLNQLYDILDTYGADPFLGVVIGNEVLFREDLTEAGLIEQLNTVRKNLASRSMGSLKVATSDLGSAWTATLAQAVDVVMSNIHPFFGGVPAPQAADWTWTFWQNNDVPLTQGLAGKQQIIAETGWPSAGGNACTDANGGNATCPSSTAGAVAGIDEMNTFMNGFICDSLKNQTNYFWFEAFDEPWKVRFNTPGEAWEDKWGLMDVDRNLKPGVVIPDCGGTEAKLPA